MKTRFIHVAAIALTSSLALGTVNALADLEISAEVQIHAAADFYEPLSANGAWVEVGTYGRCWHPAHIAVEWRPYCDGSWVWTDCGWYWESDEPWAWACYHYGTWVHESSYGWVWVPDIEWAPAWVYWRVGSGHIGWAPCPPRGGVAISSAFVFVDEHHFHERHRPSTVIVNNITIVNQTTEIRQMNRENRNIGGREQTVVINRGPDVNNIEKATGKKLTAVSVAEVQRRTIIPPTVRREKERAPAAQEKPKPAQPVVAAPELPNKPAPSDKTLRPTKPEITVPKTPPLREKPVSPPPEKKVVPPPSQPNMPPSVPPGNVERPASPPPEKKVAPPQSQPNEVRPNRPSNVPAVNEKKQNPSQDKEKAKEEKPKDRDKDMPK